MRGRRLRTGRVLLALVGLLALAGCGVGGATQTVASTPAATPTIAPVFSPIQIASQPLPTLTPYGTPAPTNTPIAERPIATERQSDKIDEILIYGDRLSKDWSLEQTQGMTYTLSSKAYVHDGSTAIEARPTRDYGELFFTVRQSSGEPFRRNQVLGVSFWINSGSGIIGTGDLAVTVVGSNAYPYYVASDDSVRLEGRATTDDPLFSETRLYYLDVRRSIPPNTWVEVVVWLDKLIKDPDYTYVTGMYIKNDVGFSQTFYVDQMRLLMRKQA